MVEQASRPQLADFLAEQLRLHRIAVASLEKQCQLLQGLMVKGLQNFRDEKFMFYQKHQEKIVSLEEEKKMDSEIKKRLSGVDAILSKARAVNPTLFDEEEGPQESLVEQAKKDLSKDKKETKDPTALELADI